MAIDHTNVACMTLLIWVRPFASLGMTISAMKGGAPATLGLARDRLFMHRVNI